MPRTKPPKIAFKFAEENRYSQRPRQCTVDMDKKAVSFRFIRWGNKMTVKISREDFDDFLTWYHMAHGLEKAQDSRGRLDTSDEV